MNQSTCVRGKDKEKKFMGMNAQGLRQGQTDTNMKCIKKEIKASCNAHCEANHVAQIITRSYVSIVDSYADSIRQFISSG